MQHDSIHCTVEFTCLIVKSTPAWMPCSQLAYGASNAHAVEAQTNIVILSICNILIFKYFYEVYFVITMILDFLHVHALKAYFIRPS